MFVALERTSARNSTNKSTCTKSIHRGVFRVVERGEERPKDQGRGEKRQKREEMKTAVASLKYGQLNLVPMDLRDGKKRDPGNKVSEFPLKLTRSVPVLSAMKMKQWSAVRPQGEGVIKDKKDVEVWFHYLRCLFWRRKGNIFLVIESTA